MHNLCPKGKANKIMEQLTFLYTISQKYHADFKLLVMAELAYFHLFPYSYLCPLHMVCTYVMWCPTFRPELANVQIL